MAKENPEIRRVSDALDRLTNRKFELEAAIKETVAAYDHYSEVNAIDLEELSDAIEHLRELTR
jgi:hypothetical protein